MNDKHQQNQSKRCSEKCQPHIESQTVDADKEFYGQWFHEKFEALHITTNCDDENDFLAYSFQNKKATPEVCWFDTDSYPIGVNLYESRCILSYVE